MLAGCPQKDGRLLGFDCADQIFHRTEPWDMVSETKEVMQMKSKKGYINKHMVFLGTKFHAKPHSLVTEKKDNV